MRIDLQCASRDDLIAFAETIGKAMRMRPRPHPWIIVLEGDGKSGKSLIPLAIDRVFRPHAYPSGLTPDLSVDRILRPQRQPPVPVAFRNFGMISYRSYDDALEDFARENPDAQILVASNVARSVTDLFNRLAGTQDSARLDLALDFEKLPGGRRHVSATTRDHLLQCVINSVSQHFTL